MVSGRFALAAVLLHLAASALALAHGHGDDGRHGTDGADGPHAPAAAGNVDHYDKPSYAGLDGPGGMMLAHIVLMVLAWFFTLPIGVVFSIARSRFALPVQFLFLVLNGLGVVCGTVYNVHTPDLYENNAHHKIGWIATWVMVAQVTMSLLFTYARRSHHAPASAPERARFLPVSVENMAQHNRRPFAGYRWSRDSAHGSGQSSTTLHSRDGSPTNLGRRDTFDDLEKPDPVAAPERDDDDDDDAPAPAAAPWWRIRVVDKYLATRVPNLLSVKILGVAHVAYAVIDRTILVLGFVAVASGGVTYGGIFRGDNIFNGLAHFIKGGIFFWYGLLTLGRWMGCFADLGWAWNVKPTRAEVGQWKAALPSGEFVESFVIFLYGVSNVWLEHLAAWGSAWSAQDLEHLSITVMFFGGGLCGMLVESQAVRRCLNAAVDVLPARTDVHPSEAHHRRAPPRASATSLNPMPALIILLLGVMMSSHHQDSAVSTMVHKQWGTLLVGFAVARMLTYIVMYLAPPTSVYGSRPPTELLSSFCLISGGLIFMASTKDVIHYLEAADIMAMFVFTVAMGLTAFIMAYELVVLALKGWAVRKELASTPASVRY